MTASLSKNYFQKAKLGLKTKIRTFYRDIIGCELDEVNPNLDIFVFPDKETYGVMYTEADDFVLSDDEYKKSTWMSLSSPDRDNFIKEIKNLGVEEIPENSDENNFFFQAPGGQVFVV